MQRSTVAAVTGIGVVATCGLGKEAFWQGLLTEPADGDRRIADWDPSPWFENPKEVRRTDRFAQFAVAACDMALKESQLADSYEASRIATMVATGIGGIGTLEAQVVVQHTKGSRRVSPFLVPMMMGNSAGATLSMRHGFQGPCETIVTACAAGTHSIGRSLDLLRLGRCDVVIAGGAEASITPTALAGFGNMTALSKSGHSMPFDKNRDGFVIAEGAAILVLEDFEKAKARGANILGLITGSASTADAHHITAPSPQGEGAIRCAAEAIKDAGLQPSDIRQVNAHGTSTPLNDSAETKAMATLFGADGPPTTSIKGVTGHSFGAAGALEAASVLLSMEKKLIPPTLGTKEVDPGIAAAVDIVTEARPWEPGPTISNSFGFGGHNGTIVLEPAPAD